MHVHSPTRSTGQAFRSWGGSWLQNRQLNSINVHEKLEKLEQYESQRIVTQVAQALWHIHNKNMMHLDVKSANVLITENNEMVLADFGIATYRSSSIHAIKGTSPYMASEVWQNHPDYP